MFFGETPIGSRMTNLTYMLAFEDMAARERSWATFRADPEWKQLWSTPGLTDAEIASNVTSVLLRPVPYSQISVPPGPSRETACLHRPDRVRSSALRLALIPIASQREAET